MHASGFNLPPINHRALPGPPQAGQPQAMSSKAISKGTPPNPQIPLQQVVPFNDNHAKRVFSSAFTDKKANRGV